MSRKSTRRLPPPAPLATDTTSKKQTKQTEQTNQPDDFFEPPTAGRTVVQKFELERFASKLQELRMLKGWSQSALAREVWGEIELASGRKAARNRDRISSYEMGKGYPDPHNLLAIAKALGVSVAELAPDITGATVERQFPELAVTSVAGHPDKVLLRVNKLITLEMASKIMTLLTGS